MSKADMTTENQQLTIKPPSMVIENETPRAVVQKAEPLPAPHVPKNTAKEIGGAIASVMSEIGVVTKTGYNNFHRYKFASMEDILKKLQPLMAKHGIAVIPSEKSRAMFDGDRVIAIEYAFTIMHRSGEVWPERPVYSGMSRCRDSKGGFDDKAMNKCATAARKYFLIGMFQIVTGEEDDADNEKIPTRPVPKHDADGVILDDEIPDFGPPEGVAVPKTPPEAGTPVGSPTGVPVSDFHRYHDELRQAAEEGVDTLYHAWKLIPPNWRVDKYLIEAKDKLKKRADQVDAAKEV